MTQFYGLSNKLKWMYINMLYVICYIVCIIYIFSIYYIDRYIHAPIKFIGAIVGINICKCKYSQYRIDEFHSNVKKTVLYLYVALNWLKNIYHVNRKCNFKFSIIANVTWTHQGRRGIVSWNFHSLVSIEMSSIDTDGQYRHAHRAVVNICC